MKVVILAGGLGTRLSEETSIRPKPMVEIGGRPILWHIMKMYSHFGCTEFIVCLGYKGYVIKEYFANYFLHMSDVSFHMRDNKLEVHKQTAEPWQVTLIETGDNTQTGGRLKRVIDKVAGDPYFALTYGDGVADIDIAAEVAFHKSHGGAATVAAVRPPSRYGVLRLDGNRVSGFEEKPEGDGAGWINGGFFILSPAVGNLIAGDHIAWEREPMTALADSGQLHAHFHRGFWHPMDTLRDRMFLEQQWQTGTAPWKTW